MSTLSANEILKRVVTALISISENGKYKPITINENSPNKTQGKGLRVYLAQGTPLPVQLESDLALIGWSCIHKPNIEYYQGKPTKPSVLCGPIECFDDKSTDDTSASTLAGFNVSLS